MKTIYLVVIVFSLAGMITVVGFILSDEIKRVKRNAILRQMDRRSGR